MTLSVFLVNSSKSMNIILQTSQHYLSFPSQSTAQGIHAAAQQEADSRAGTQAEHFTALLPPLLMPEHIKPHATALRCKVLPWQ